MKTFFALIFAVAFFCMSAFGQNTNSVSIQWEPDAPKTVVFLDTNETDVVSVYCSTNYIPTNIVLKAYTGTLTAAAGFTFGADKYKTNIILLDNFAGCIMVGSNVYQIHAVRDESGFAHSTLIPRGQKQLSREINYNVVTNEIFPEHYPGTIQIGEKFYTVSEIESNAAAANELSQVKDREQKQITSAQFQRHVDFNEGVITCFGMLQTHPRVTVAEALELSQQGERQFLAQRNRAAP